MSNAAYSFNPNPVINVLRGTIKQVFTDLGEVPVSIPLCTTAAQIAIDASTPFPLNVIEIKSTPFSEEGMAEWTFATQLHAIVHHVRQLDPEGSAILDANTRMAALASYVAANPHLGTAAGDPYIEEACPVGLLCGEDNPLQMQLMMKDQNVSLAIVSLVLTLRWVEPSA